MKILWIVNMLLPEAADCLGVKAGFSGTWMINLSKQLAATPEIDLAIACIHGEKFRDFMVDNTRYFCIPGNGKTMLFYHPEIIQYWDMIEERFSPDIVHFHGTEYSHGISYLRKYPDKKKVLTIQGIIDKTSYYHWGGLPVSVLLKYRMLSECLYFNGMIERKILARRNVKYENELIRTIPYATGRTDWDKYYMQSVNPTIQYYRCYYDLREEFYTAPKWNINKVHRNVIFASTSAQVPMKGGHKAMGKINSGRTKVILDIYTTDELTDEQKTALNRNGCQVHGALALNEVQAVQEDADILVFAECLEDPYRYTARLSFSTKVTDYLRAGKCIFAIGDKDIAPIDYFTRYDSAVTATNYEEVYAKLQMLVDRPELITEYGKKGYECGCAHHDEQKMSQLFTQTIMDAAKK